MGGVCSGGTVNRNENSDQLVYQNNSGFSGARFQKDDVSFDVFDKSLRHLFDSSELPSISSELTPHMLPTAPPNMAQQIPSFFGKAGIAGLEKAVDVLDALGSSMANLNSSGFSAGVTSRTHRIRILAFEVANTIAKGSNLLQSLSEENIRELKTEILTSQGVKRLVSTDMKELLIIAATDKREEFDVFAREVIRFGNLCKDPQWHNLDRFFSRLDSETDVHKQKRQEAEMTMQELTTLAQHTSELYHELHALDRFEQDYRRKVEEMESLHLPRKGECLTVLQSELKHQRKLMIGMKKKSLWSKTLEQVVEKFVEIVTFMHQEIIDAFGDNCTLEQGKQSTAKPERLGMAGLALHYASIITQIDNIASRPTSLPPNMRDTLYDGLPPSIKIALRSRLQLYSKEEVSFMEIKAEMEKYLDWLAPLAADTTRAHQGFGCVGEWANSGNEFGKKTSNTIRLQTLYHADKGKMESYIIDLLMWLHRLVSLVRYRDKPLAPKLGSNMMSSEDRFLLENVMKRRKVIPRVSKSEELVRLNKNGKRRNCGSTGSSPRVAERRKVDVLDLLDGLDSSLWVPTPTG